MNLSLQTFIENLDAWKVLIASFFSIIAITIAYKNYKKKSSNTTLPIQIENSNQNSPTNNNTNNLTVNFASNFLRLSRRPTPPDTEDF